MPTVITSEKDASVRLMSESQTLKILLKEIEGKVYPFLN